MAVISKMSGMMRSVISGISVQFIMFRKTSYRLYKHPRFLCFRKLKMVLLIMCLCVYVHM